MNPDRFLDTNAFGFGVALKLQNLGINQKAVPEGV
jgi:hypothetical protein